MALLRSYLAMLPRLSAERDLSEAQVALAVSAMHIEPQDAQRWSEEVRRIAEGGGDRPRVAASPEALAAMGIAFEIVEA